MQQSAQTILQTEFGIFNFFVYTDGSKEHVVLSQGDLKSNDPLLVRVQSECLTGEIFHSLHCDCRGQLDLAMKKISEVGRGALIYLRQEGRDIGLTNKIKAYELQRQGLDTVEANIQLGLPADARVYTSVVTICHDLGISSINLLTNNPNKVEQLKKMGIDVRERIALEIPPNGVDNKYLSVKKHKMGHWLDQV